MYKRPDGSEIRHLAWGLRDAFKNSHDLDVPMSTIVPHVEAIIEEVIRALPSPSRFIGGRIIDIETNDNQVILCVATEDGTVQRIWTTKGTTDGI